MSSNGLGAKATPLAVSYRVYVDVENLTRRAITIGIDAEKWIWTSGQNGFCYSGSFHLRWKSWIGKDDPQCCGQYCKSRIITKCERDRRTRKYDKFRETNN